MIEFPDIAANCIGVLTALDDTRVTIRVTYTPMTIGQMRRAMWIEGFDISYDVTVMEDTSFLMSVSKMQYKQWIRFANRYGIGWE